MLGVSIEKREPAGPIWRDLLERFEVYLLRKSYGDPAEEKKIVKQWEAALEPQRIIAVNDEERAVDLALGLIARSWGRFDDFEKNMQARQPVAKVKALANSLDARSFDSRTG